MDHSEIDDLLIHDDELAFRVCLLRLFRTQLINYYSGFISDHVDKTIQEANANGITNYNDWMDWVANGKKGADQHAEPEGTGAGLNVAQKQNSRKGHA